MLLFLVLAALPTASQAHAALEKTCGRCHSGQDADEGGFDFLFDRDALVREQFVVPGDPRGSRLVQRLRRAEMPPPEAWPNLPAREQARRRAEVLAALEPWIRAGAPAEGFDAPKPVADVLLTADAATRAALEDLKTLSTRDTIRWFAVRRGEELALAKALNSMSWRPKLVHPALVSPGLARVDIEDLGWSTADWEQVLLGAYPFGVSTGSLDEETLGRATSSRQPVLRADWFIANATRPPLYHALAHSPSNEAGLESLLDVRVKEDIDRGAVVRSGFTSSGVSQNNRLIERHSTRFGPYWRSYDFMSNVGQRNLFERPLTFVHDGGEHIYSLPNGLFGYLLTDARGGRIERGPTSIVRDPRRPDGAVENGLSCMGCHARGLIPKADQVGPTVRLSQAGFTARERRLVDLLHPEGEAALGLFTLDTRRFLSALAELGIDPSLDEPVTKVALQYERDVDVREGAEELGVTPGALTRALEHGPEALAPLKLGGAVKRDAFVAAFPVLLERLHLGRAIDRWNGWVGASRPPVVCGLSGSIAARLEECAGALPAGSAHGAFKLVVHDAGGREVWLDETRRLLWGPVQVPATQSDAAARCADAALVDGLWFLPGAEELEAAVGDGLPGGGWQALWTREQSHEHKYGGPPGLAVSSSGKRVEAQSSRLPSRCATRL